jgi:uncharacterized protein (DUF2147 family)
MPLHQTITMAFLIYMISRNVLAHLGFELFPKGFAGNKLFNWHTTATHHNMHHKYFDCNYGFYFTWWDNWLKTTHRNYEVEFEKAASGDAKELNGKIVSVKAALMMAIIFLTVTSINGQSIIGNWTTYDESSGDALAVIKIDSSSTGIIGNIAKIVVNPHQTLDPICTKCEGQNKNQKIIGLQMLWGFKKSLNEWQNGKILDPNNGVVYKSKIWLESRDLLKVRGYGGPMSLFWRTQDWIRIGQESTSVIGLWKSIDDRTGYPRAIIEISKEDSTISGRIMELFWLPDEGPNPICLECEGDLKKTKIVGMKMLWDFEYAKGQFVNGKIMGPGNGKTYNSSMWLLDNENLKIRGYWGPFFRTQVWKKISSLRTSSLLKNP